MIDEMVAEGFEAAAKTYGADRTQPHHHDYDVCLHIVEGEFKLDEVAAGKVHSFGPGDRVFVSRGIRHAEEHGPLRMIVGRRH